MLNVIVWHRLEHCFLVPCNQRSKPASSDSSVGADRYAVTIDELLSVTSTTYNKGAIVCKLMVICCS